MLYLVEQFDDVYLQILVDILHKDVEKYLELFSRLSCSDVKKLDNFGRIIDQYSKWSTNISENIENDYKSIFETLKIEENLVNDNNCMREDYWKLLLTMSNSINERQTQLYNLLVEIREDQLFTIRGPSGLSIKTTYDENDTLKQLLKYNERNSNNRDNKSLIEEVEKLKETYLATSVDHNRTRIKTKDEMLINFSNDDINNSQFVVNQSKGSEKINLNSFNFNGETSMLGSNIKTEFNSELSINEFEKLCISKPDSELSSFDFASATDMSHLQPEGVKITNNSFLSDFGKNNEYRHAFLNYLLNKVEDIVQPLPIPRTVPKDRVKQTILEPFEDFDELQFFQLNDSTLIPKNWSQLTPDDVREEEINIFDFKVPENCPETSSKEVHGSVKDEFMMNVENLSNPSENINMSNTCAYKSIRRDNVPSTSTLNADSPFFQVTKKIYDEITDGQRVCSKLKKLPDDVLLSDDLPNDFRNFKAFFLSQYANVEKNISTSLRAMMDNNCEKMVDEKLSKIRKKFASS